MPGEVHRKIADCICGQDGRKEFPLRDGRKLDCWKPNTCVEVELSKGRIAQALSRLDTGKAEELCNKQVLVVKEKDVEFAISLAKSKGVEVRSASQACPIGAGPRPKGNHDWGLFLSLLGLGIAGLALSQRGSPHARS